MSTQNTRDNINASKYFRCRVCQLKKHGIKLKLWRAREQNRIEDVSCDAHINTKSTHPPNLISGAKPAKSLCAAISIFFVLSVQIRPFFNAVWAFSGNILSQQRRYIKWVEGVPPHTETEYGKVPNSKAKILRFMREHFVFALERLLNRKPKKDLGSLMEKKNI